jgi:fibulin 1/2
MTCGTGYTLNFDTGRCEDNDECAVGTHNCDALGPGYLCRNIQVAKKGYLSNLE